MRLRSLRPRHGVTRKELALTAGVSERHLANLEYGIGSASFLVLLQVTQALQCSLAELIGDVTTDIELDTSTQALDATFSALRGVARGAIEPPG